MPIKLNYISNPNPELDYISCPKPRLSYISRPKPSIPIKFEVVLLLTFTITDSIGAVEGATISINGEELTTDELGMAHIYLHPGTYDYTVTKSGYQDYSDSVTMSNINVVESVTLEEQEYNVTFVVSDSEGFIEGAEIAINSQTLTTDVNGEATIQLSSNTYLYIISKAGYNDIVDIATVSGSDATVTETLTPSAFDVVFTVDDGTSAIEGASVTLDGVTQLTDVNGQTTFTKENGTYNYEVTADGYSTESGSVVVDGADVDVDVSISDISAFTFTIDTTKGDGDNTFQLPLRSGYIYDFEVDWGDGSLDTITSYNQAETDHTYSIVGVYQIKIKGTCQAWYFNNGGDKDKPTIIEQWGQVDWRDMNSAFFGCSNLVSVTATDGENVQNVS